MDTVWQPIIAALTEYHQRRQALPESLTVSVDLYKQMVASPDVQKVIHYDPQLHPKGRIGETVLYVCYDYPKNTIVLSDREISHD